MSGDDQHNEAATSRTDPPSDNLHRPKVVVVGAGFAGLSVARGLAGAPVDVLLIDRNNYHGFWPLLYQVAAAGLHAQEVVVPLRTLVRRWPNVRFLLASVEHIDRERQVVITNRREVAYDQLVVAPGSITNFYGLDQVEEHGFQLKDIPDAVAIRNHLLTRFEQASTETDPEEIRRLLTFVIVGGGPTGVELAGAIAELIRHVLRKDYPGLDFSLVRVVLLEALDRVLLPFPPVLSARARDVLTRLGVEVLLNAQVTAYENNELQLSDGKSMPAATVIWTAGVRGAPLGASLQPEPRKDGRVVVTPELRLPHDPRVWVIGDLAFVEQEDGKPYPQLAAVAVQQGKSVADNIKRGLQGGTPRPFRYLDKGTLATIGRRSAVARVWKFNWSGPAAWYLWLVVHLWQLAGFHNRLLVFIDWAYSYFTFDRANRAVVPASRRTRDEFDMHTAALIEADDDPSPSDEREARAG